MQPLGLGVRHRSNLGPASLPHWLTLVAVGAHNQGLLGVKFSCRARRFPAFPMATLDIIQGGEIGRKYELTETDSVLGRSPDCDVVIDAAAVSRRHAIIEKNGGGYFLRDLGSRNGTYVNGTRVEERAPLHNGDRIVVCDVVFQFRDLAIQEDEHVSSLLGPMAGQTGDVRVEVGEMGTDPGSSVLATLDVRRDTSAFQFSANPETQLQAMLEISNNLSNTLSVQDILPKVLDSLFKIFVQADRGFVIMRPGPDRPLAAVASKARRGDDSQEIRFSKTIVEQAMETQKAFLSADATTDERFHMAQSIADFEIRSLICAPMISSDGESLGVLQIDTSDQRSRFTDQDLEVLAGIANQAAIAVDNANLHEESIRQRALQRDLEVARQMQQALLPDQALDVPGYHFFDYYESAQQVGGDYYDYVELPNDRFAAIMGDVAGKGVSAAILMANLASDVRFYLATEPDPAKALGKINAAFSRHGWDDRFVTMILAVVDPAAHEMTLVNAGHMPPLLRTGNGEVLEVGGEEAGLPLGVMEDFQFEAYKRPLESGDFLVMFTDGFSEAMNSRKELFGLERLADLVGDLNVPVKSLGENILTAVRRFAGDYPQSDDMCLVCFGRE